MRILVVSLLSIGLLSGQLAANETSIQELSAQKLGRINYLLERHKPAHMRPVSCPMESKQHANILGKIKNIKNLFKDNCLDIDPARLDELLSGAESIQTEIDIAATSTGTTAVQTSAMPTQVNGQQIGSVVNSINSILTSGQCKFEDSSFLENAADMITSFSQMGLLVPNANGLLISAGGFALSSVLRIIHSLFTPLFNFENNTERQTFIKLNCAFYDIRRDIEVSGFMDVPTDQHGTDLVETKMLVKELEERLKAIAKEKSEILTHLEKQEAAAVAEGLGKLSTLKKLVKQAHAAVSVPVVDTDGIPATTIKLRIIQELTLLRDSLRTALKTYIEAGLSKIAPLDNMLDLELNKLESERYLDDYMALINLDNKVFNDGFRASLLFHFERIAKDIETNKIDLAKKYNEETLIDGLKVPEFKKALDKKVSELLKSIGETHKKVKIVELRLARISTDRDYTSTDDGSENIVSILSDYNEIASQIYGEWGEKFLRYTAENSYKTNKLFDSKFDTFAKDHLNNGAGKYQVPLTSEVSELRTLYACQDAKPFRRSWKLADSLSQQGFDFLATNKDLFHSDTAESLVSGIHLRRSDFERIQQHYKSAMFAKIMIKGGEVSKQQKERYLKKRSGHKRYLGMVMLDVNRSKAKAALIQELIERFDCGKVTTEN